MLICTLRLTTTLRVNLRRPESHEFGAIQLGAIIELVPNNRTEQKDR